MEVRNSDESSSESEEEEEEEEREAPPVEEMPTKSNETYGVTNEKAKKQEHLQMPKINKPAEKTEIDKNKNEAQEQHQMNIQEAFADDDVLAEFEKEKVTN